MKLQKILDKIKKKIDAIEKLHDKESLLCEEVKDVSPNTLCHATMVGVGDSTISIQPLESRNAIRNKVKESLLELKNFAFLKKLLSSQLSSCET